MMTRSPGLLALAALAMVPALASAQYYGAPQYSAGGPTPGQLFSNYPYQYRLNPGLLYGSNLGSVPWQMQNQNNWMYTPSYTSGNYNPNWAASPYYSGNWYGFTNDGSYPRMGSGYNYNQPNAGYMVNPGAQPAPGSSGATGGMGIYTNPQYSGVASGDPHPHTPGLAAHVEIKLPANAELWFDGNKMTQTGPERRFMTPPLELNHVYSYDVQAKWTENGKEVSKSQKLLIRAGQQVAVSFLPTAKIEEVKPGR